MDEAHVRLLVDELDRAIPKDGAEVRLFQYGGGPDETKFVGTRQGYLRFGVEFLKGGIGPFSGDTASSVKVDLDYLVTSDSDVGLDWFERHDYLPAADHLDPPSWRNRLIGWVIVGVVIAFFGCAILGLLTAIEWAF